MIKGVILALAACFIWGFIFIIPTFMTHFDSFEIAMGRHGVFGFMSLQILAYYFFYLKKRFAWQIWFTALCFTLVANIVYYTCVVLSVKLASSSVAALVMGISPILIAFYGSWIEKDGQFTKLILPCLFVLIGLGFIHYRDFLTPSSSFDFYYFLGVINAVIALLAWSWYVVANARFLKTHPEISPTEWVTIIGSSTFFWVILLGGGYELYQGQEHWQKFFILTPELKTFLSGCVILGMICSWVGAYFWNQASAMLPVSLTGQLSIFETVFGLVFFYFLENHLPPLLEIVGILCILVSVVYAVRTNQQNFAHA